MSGRLLSVGSALIACVVAAAPVSAQTNALALKDVMAMAINQSPALDIARARLAQSMARSTQVRSDYWPRVTVPAGFSKESYSDSSVIGAISQQDSVEYYRLGLKASWLLFDGFARRNRKLSAEQAEEQFDAALDDSVRLLLGGVASAYHSAQLARENLRIASADESFNQKQLHEAQFRLNAGAGSRSDVLNFEGRRNAATSEVLRHQERLDIALAALAEVIGLPGAAMPVGATLVELTDDVAIQDVSVPATQTVAMAEMGRPDLRAARLGVDRSESNVKSAKGDRWPSVALNGSFDGERQDDASFDGDDFGNTVGVALNYTFINGGERRGRVSEAQSAVDENEAVLRALGLTVAKEVRQALAVVDGARKRLVLQTQNVVTVLENRNLTEKAYRGGNESLVRLNEAQRDLIAAEGQLALARVALHEARVRLDVATGKILDSLQRR